MQILYIGQKTDKISGGADVINKRNFQLLERISNGKICFISLSNSSSLLNKWCLGISKGVLKEIDNCILNQNISHVFLSQSLLGRAAKFINTKYPDIKIITFCHNIEIDYAKSYLKTVGWKALPFYLSVRRWEKFTYKFSSRIITLNHRDSERLNRLYGKKSDLQLPTSFDDSFDKQKALRLFSKENSKIDYLFVGVAFFPNIQGIQWFIDNIMPHVKGHLYVVGSGMNNVKFSNLSERIHIEGYVEDLSECYYRAKIVVSPIFTGAGMKTKTAEALMHGRAIVGTKEAFEGYDIDSRCMLQADSVEDFIYKLNNLPRIVSCGYNEFARMLFLKNHETSNQLNNLKSIF